LSPDALAVSEFVFSADRKSAPNCSLLFVTSKEATTLTRCAIESSATTRVHNSPVVRRMLCRSKLFHCLNTLSCYGSGSSGWTRSR